MPSPGPPVATAASSPSTVALPLATLPSATPPSAAPPSTIPPAPSPPPSLPQSGDGEDHVSLPAGAPLGGKAVQSTLGDDATHQSTPGASAPTAPTGLEAWTLATTAGDNDSANGAGAGVMPTPPQSGAFEGLSPLSLDSMLISAATETMAIGHEDESSTRPGAAAGEDASAATPAPTVAATRTSPLAASTHPVAADGSSTTEMDPAAANDPYDSSVRTTLGDLDRLSGVS